MTIDWKTVIATMVAIAILAGLWMLLTKKKINPDTGAIETKFSGFGGDGE